MFERKQADLLEQYLAALRHDAQAVPPPDLDPTLAELARKLKAQRMTRPTSDVRARVWQRALAASRNTANRPADSLTVLPADKLQAQDSGAGRQPYRVAYPMTLAVASLAVIVLLAVMLIVLNAPKQQEEQYAGQGTESPVVESTPSVEMGNLIKVEAAEVGATYTDVLTTTQPVVIYQFTLSEPGIVLARAESDDFEPMLFYTTGLPGVGAGGATWERSMPLLGEGGRTFVPDRTVQFLSRRPNPIWFPATPGDVVKVHLNTSRPGLFGRFTFKTELIAPTPLIRGESQTLAISSLMPLQYFVFDSLADERINIRLSDVSGIIPHVTLVDVGSPVYTLMPIPHDLLLQDTGLDLSREVDGTTGMVIEAANEAPDGAFTILLNQSNSQ